MILLSIFSAVRGYLPSAAFANGSVLISVPQAPFALKEQLYNARTSIVFRVEDSRGASYALKVFASTPELDEESKARRMFEFANARRNGLRLTETTCEKLVVNVRLASAKQPHEDTVECPDEFVTLTVDLDVPVFNSKKELLSTMDMRIPNFRGELRPRSVVFSHSELLPYSGAGGRLNDILHHSPRYQSVLMRYQLYTQLAPQLIHAIQYIHRRHMVHLSIQATNVICTDDECSHVMLSDWSRAWNGDGPLPVAANEVMQESVRFIMLAQDEDLDNTHDGRMHPDREPRQVTERLARYFNETDFQSSQSVDWYALGGTLYYVLSGVRPVAEERSEDSTRDVAEFAFNLLNDPGLLSSLTDEAGKAALVKLRSHVVDAMIMVDGLLEEKRSKRISFDEYDLSSSTGMQKLASTIRRLRSASTLASALQTDSVPQTAISGVGVSCMDYLLATPQDSVFSREINVEKSMPAFMQDVCSRAA